MANLFPAPTWKVGDGEKPQFQFDLILINDNIVKARNNYMCVNTIINNNRSIQKAILAFPGALYEVWLPTGQRHLMCTGSFQLYPLGLNRRTPKGFFTGGPDAASNFEIGSDHPLKKKNPHQEGVEVIPDAYKLSITFKSCLANNLNTSIFQYYVKMQGYDDYSSSNMGGDDVGIQIPGALETMTRNAEEVKESDFESGGGGSQNESTSLNNGGAPSQKAAMDGFRRALGDIVDGYDDTQLREDVGSFEESTYKVKFAKLKSYLGDKARDAKSVVLAIKAAQRTIRESTEFLGRLYNAEGSNLWYRPDATEELYTTIKPSYRQVLRKKYGEKLAEIRKLDSEIAASQAEVEETTKTLSAEENFQERERLIGRKVDLLSAINALKRKRDDEVNQSLQIDVDLIQAAWDDHDSVVSIKRSPLTGAEFRKVWNEKIMNSYERDKLQYLTSEEKTRYFAEKVRELKKHDPHGILNHPDWFFRVAVLDLVVGEMRRLVDWMKYCSYDSFDTVYRIVRKLELLQLDAEAVRTPGEFQVNKTNLFFVSDADAKAFTKIDGLLDGATLYELFQNQVVLNFTKVGETVEPAEDGESDSASVHDKKLVKEEQDSEEELRRQRTVRQDVVARAWGSEEELTKAAYARAELDSEEDGGLPVQVGSQTFSSLKELKEAIIALKLAPNQGESNALQELLGAFTSRISFIKEALVMEKMAEMGISATQRRELEDAVASVV